MQGEYECQANQHEHTLSSRPVQVLVQPIACRLYEKPERFVRVTEGCAALLKVKADGYPPPEFEWTHENSVLHNKNSDYLYVSSNRSNLGALD